MPKDNEHMGKIRQELLDEAAGKLISRRRVRSEI